MLEDNNYVLPVSVITFLNTLLPLLNMQTSINFTEIAFSLNIQIFIQILFHASGTTAYKLICIYNISFKLN